SACRRWRAKNSAAGCIHRKTEFTAEGAEKTNVFILCALCGEMSSRRPAMKVIEVRNQFGLEPFTIVERPNPTAGPGQVVVKVRGTYVNYRDLLGANGAYDPKLKLPYVPLSDCAGQVVEVGPGATRLRIGDRVANLFMPKWIEGDLTSEKSQSSLGASND